MFDHGFEGSYDRLLCGPESLETFLKNYLRRAMFKNPLDGFNCWEAPQAE